jgi:hypothetical protein
MVPAPRLLNGIEEASRLNSRPSDWIETKLVHFDSRLPDLEE